MTPLQQAMLLCFVIFPSLVVVQSLWIVWLVWFSSRGQTSHFQASRQRSQRRLPHSPAPLHTTVPTLVQVTVGDRAEGQPTQRTEVNAL